MSLSNKAHNMVFTTNDSRQPVNDDSSSQNSSCKATKKLTHTKSNLKSIHNSSLSNKHKKVNIAEEYYKSSPLKINNTNLNEASLFVGLNEINETTPLNVPTTVSPPTILVTQPSSQDKNKNTNNNVEINNEESEIKYYLDLREEEKRRNSKRRESIRKKRVSYESANEVRKSRQIEITEIISMIEKSEQNTSLGQYKRLKKIIDITLAIIIFANISITLIDNEIYMNKSDEYLQSLNKVLTTEVLHEITNRTISSIENSLRFINVGLVTVAFLLVCAHYHIKIMILISDCKLSKYDNLISSGQYKYFFIELIIVSIVYPPFLNKAVGGTMLNVYFVYSINSIFSIFVICKSYLIFRVYTYFARWTSDSAKSIGNKYNVSTGMHFALKSELKQRPYSMLIILTCIITIILAFCIRTFE